jgi:hypothetical protein
MLKMFYCQDWLANKIEAANNGIKSDSKKPPRLMPNVEEERREERRAFPFTTYVEG